MRQIINKILNFFLKECYLKLNQLDLKVKKLETKIAAQELMMIDGYATIKNNYLIDLYIPDSSNLEGCFICNTQKPCFKSHSVC